MQIKPHQIKHFAEQQRRIKEAISHCNFDSYNLVGSYLSKINEFEKDYSKTKYLTNPKNLVYANNLHHNGNTILNGSNGVD